MRARRLLDSCILAATPRTGPVQGTLGMTPKFWIEPSSADRVTKLMQNVVAFGPNMARELAAQDVTAEA